MQHELDQSETPTNKDILLFIVILSGVCALILSSLAALLREPQKQARNLYRSQQMLVAARYLDQNTQTFLLSKENLTEPALYNEGSLIKFEDPTLVRPATSSEIVDFYQKRFIPLVVNDKGELSSFEDAKLPSTYVEDHQKSGYSTLEWKLIYKIIDPTKNDQIIGWVIPVNGFGLWDAIYGYLAIDHDGKTVRGISWYDQKETPGLGANITEDSWQIQFPGKSIFQPDNAGKIDLQNSPIGIKVLKGRVQDIYGDSPKSESAVDGMTGATLTGNGVTDAYKDILEAYRPFLLSIAEKEKNLPLKQNPADDGEKSKILTSEVDDE